MNEEIYCFTDGINLFQPNIAFLKKTFAHKKNLHHRCFAGFSLRTRLLMLVIIQLNVISQGKSSSLAYESGSSLAQKCCLLSVDTRL